MREEDKKMLIKTAIEGLSGAYAPYSHFFVSAALLCGDGSVFTGNNVENAAYSVTNCGERSAFFAAVSAGKREFCAIAICGGIEGNITDYCAPCGVCRQVMQEFCSPEEFLILLAKSETDYKEYRLKELLPFGFGPENLRGDER